MNNSIAANNIKGNNMRRMISVDNVEELKLLDNNATEMNTIASKMLRILLLYGFTIVCINATSMFVVSNKTWVMFSLYELIIVTKLSPVDKSCSKLQSFGNCLYNILETGQAMVILWFRNGSRRRNSGICKGTIPGTALHLLRVVTMTF